MADSSRGRGGKGGRGGRGGRSGPGGRGAAAAAGPRAEAILLWDVENCPVPSNVPLGDVYKCLLDELIIKPRRNLTNGAHVAFSPKSADYHNADLAEFSSLNIHVLVNSGVGKMGNTDNCLAMLIDDFYARYLMKVNTPEAYTAVIVFIGSDTDFHMALQQAAGRGIQVHRVYLRNQTHPLVANSPFMQTEEYMELLWRTFPHANQVNSESLNGNNRAGLGPRAAPAPNRVQAAGVSSCIGTLPPPPPPPPPPRTRAPPAVPGMAKVFLNLIGPNEEVSQGIRGPLEDASGQEIENWLRSGFEGQPGFVSIKAFIADNKFKYLWVNYRSMPEAQAARSALDKVAMTYRSGRQQARYQLAMLAPQPNLYMRQPVQLAAEVELVKVEEVSIKTTETIVQGTPGVLPKDYLLEKAQELVTVTLADRLKAMEDDYGVTIVRTAEEAGTGGSSKAARAAAKGNAIDFTDGSIKVKGTRQNLESFKRQLRSQGLDGIVHSILTVNIDNIFEPDAAVLRAEPNILQKMRLYAVDRLRVLKAKQQEHLCDSAIISSPMRKVPAQPGPGGKKSHSWRLTEEPYPGQPYVIVITSISTDIRGAEARAPRVASLASALQSSRDRLMSVQGPWAVKAMDIPKFKKLEPVVAGIKELNNLQRGGSQKYTISVHSQMDVKKYLVWGLGEEDMDAGLTELKEMIAPHVSLARPPRNTRTASSQLLFSLIKRSDEFKLLVMEAKAQGQVEIKAGPTKQYKGYLPCTFTLSGAASDQLALYTARLDKMMERTEKFIVRVEEEVPSMARCLFLRDNIGDTNACLKEMADSKDHPVWISRAERSIRIKGQAYGKDSDSDSGSSDSDSDEFASVVSSASASSLPGVGTARSCGIERAQLVVEGSRGVKHTVTLVQGGIDKEGSQLLVNAANGSMLHVGGVAKAIADAAGPEMSTDSDKLRDSLFGGTVPVGRAVLTVPGKLQQQGVKNILHVVTPQHSSPVGNKAMASCVQEIMEAMASRKLGSASMPILGAGVYCWPVVEATDIILANLQQALIDSQSPTPLSIRLVENDNTKVATAATRFVACGGKELAVTPTQASIAAAAAAQERVDWAWWADIGEDIFIKDPSTQQLPAATHNGKSGKWIPMAMSISTQLEHHYQKWWASTFSSATESTVLSMDNMKYAKADYKFEFAKMQQTNLQKGYVRPILRTPVALAGPPLVHSSAAASPSAAAPPLPIAAAQRPTSVAASDTAAKEARATARAAAKEQAAATYRKAVLSGPIVLLFEGEKKTVKGRVQDNVDRAIQNLRRSFASLCRSETKVSPIPLNSKIMAQLADEAFRRSLRLQLDGQDDGTCSMTVEGMKEKVAGFIRHVWDDIIHEEVKRQTTQAALRTRYPDTWETTDDQDGDDGGSDGKPTFHDLLKPPGPAGPQAVSDRVQPEVAFVLDVWGRTMDPACVLQITRVQATSQYDSFNQIKESHHKFYPAALLPYKDKYDPDLNSSMNKWLWHGTRGTPPETVIKNAHGLGRSWSDDRCLWGPANYFAVDAKYSATLGYHYTKADGTKQVLLFEVLTGYAKDYGTTTEKVPKMPAIPASDPNYQALMAADPSVQYFYNSISGITAGSRVHMTHNEGSAWQYPHYIVTYK